jgi:hypothetical protein
VKYVICLCSRLCLDRASSGQRQVDGKHCRTDRKCASSTLDWRNAIFRGCSTVDRARGDAFSASVAGKISRSALLWTESAFYSMVRANCSRHLVHNGWYQSFLS